MLADVFIAFAHLGVKVVNQVLREQYLLSLDADATLLSEPDERFILSIEIEVVPTREIQIDVELARLQVGGEQQVRRVHRLDVVDELFLIVAKDCSMNLPSRNLIKPRIFPMTLLDS